MKGLRRCGWFGIYRFGFCILVGRLGCGIGLGIYKGGVRMFSDM